MKDVVFYLMAMIIAVLTGIVGFLVGMLFSISEINKASAEHRKERFSRVSRIIHRETE